MRSTLIFVFFLAACRPPSSQVGSEVPPPPRAEAKVPASEALVHGRISIAADTHLASPARGNIGIYWMTADEAEAQKKGTLSVRTMIDLFGRVVAVKNVDLSLPGQTAEYSIRPAPGDIVIMAILDRRNEFLPTLLGDGGEGNLRGSSAKPRIAAAGQATAIDVSLSEVVHVAESPEACSGDRFRLDSIAAPEVAGSMNNRTARRVCVHMPPSYGAEPTRRYPVLYAFAGLMGSDASGSILATMNAVDEVGRGRREVIVVGVDLRTNYGSSYLTSSTIVGDFDSFLVKGVVAHVDAHYRTAATPRKRGLIGQSTGGFNAVSFGLRHADTFRAIVASSPDGLDFPSWFLTRDGLRVSPRWLGWMRMEDQLGPPGQMVSYAAEWSPDPEKPRGFAWPADLATGALVPDVWAKWVAHSPSVLLRDPAILASARAYLSGRILLAAGTHDEADLFEPTRHFSEALRAAGVDNTFANDDAGHFGPAARLHTMVDFALTVLAD